MVEVNGSKRLSREVGCKRNGTLIYGKRFYFSNGGFNAIYPEDASLTRLDFPMVSINKEDRI